MPSGISSPFDPNNQRKKALDAGKSLSVLYQHEQNIGSDYLIDNSTDLIKGQSSYYVQTPRYAYIEIKIGDGFSGDKNHKHYLNITQAGENTKFSDINLDDKENQFIRYCNSYEDGYKQYVIQYPINKIGDLTLSLYDPQNKSGTGDLLVAQGKVVISSADKIITKDKPTPQEYNSSIRKLDLITIDLANTENNLYGKKIPPLGLCGLQNVKLKNFKSALEDVYSLNQNFLTMKKYSYYLKEYK